MQTVSCLIVTYNSRHMISACLSAIPTQAGAYAVETVVVDNASQDDTAGFIRAAFPAVRVIENPQNAGFGAGNNLGAQAASGDYLLLVNPDLVLNSALITTLADTLREHPDIGVVAPRLLEGEADSGEIALSARPSFTVWRVLAQFLGFGQLFSRLLYGRYPALLRGDTPFEAAWLQGACLMLPRAVYEAVGGFDDDFFLFCEDVDLCDRVRAAGYRVVCVPGVSAHHAGSTTVRRFSLIRIRTYHQSPILYFRKRGQRGAVWLLKAGFMLELSLKLSLRTLLQWARPSDSRRDHLRAERQVLGEIRGY